MKKNDKNLVVLAIVLLLMVIGGVILNMDASAKNAEPEEKGFVEAHWLGEDGSLKESLDIILDEYETYCESVSLNKIEWNDEYGRHEIYFEADGQPVCEYVYRSR